MVKLTSGPSQLLDAAKQLGHQVKAMGKRGKTMKKRRHFSRVAAQLCKNCKKVGGWMDMKHEYLAKISVLYERPIPISSNFYRLKMPARTLADPFVLTCLCSRGYFGSSPGPDEREAELLGFGAGKLHRELGSKKVGTILPRYSKKYQWQLKNECIMNACF